MALTYFGNNEEYVLNHYRARKLGSGHVVTNDYGSWVYLTDEEYMDLKKEKINGPLFSVLKEKGFILKNDNIKQVIEEHREKCKYLFQGTSLHIVVPTLRCNMKCVYCHAKAKPVTRRGYDMDEKTAKKIVDFIFQSPSKDIMIEFQGGEPLLNFDIVKYIVEYANEKNFIEEKNLSFDIVTNLVDMTDDKLDFLVENKVGICTSLDGPEIVQNKNRANYKKTVKWVKKLKKDNHVQAMLLVTKHSLPFHKEIVDEYLKLGLPKIWIKPVNKLGYALDNWSKIGITAEEFLDFYKKALDYIVKKNKEIIFPENHTTIFLRKILTKKCVNYTDMESPCGAAIAQLAYSYDGSIYTCDEGRLYDIFKLGTIEQKYPEIVTSSSACSVVRASINDNPVCELCAYKPMCGLCPVCSYAERGNIISKLPDHRCDILIGMFDHIFDKLVNDEEYRNVFMKWIDAD